MAPAPVLRDSEAPPPCRVDPRVLYFFMVYCRFSGFRREFASGDPRVGGFFAWFRFSGAEVAELVDALGSGSSGGNLVGVRVSPSAPSNYNLLFSR